MLEKIPYCWEIWVLMEGVSDCHKEMVLTCPYKALQQDGPVVQNRLSEFDWRLKDLLNLRIRNFPELV